MPPTPSATKDLTSHVTEDEKHAADLNLAHQCLELDRPAIESLRRKYSSFLTSFLRGSGAGAAEATEIVETLWTDCVAGQGPRPPRLQRYRGQCALGHWLKTVALHELIDRRRRDERHRLILAQAVSPITAGHSVPQADGALLPSNPANPPSGDVALLQIMRAALIEGLRACPAEELTILQLIHLNHLTQRQVAAVWHVHESSISRRLEAAMKLIATETMRRVAAVDPWLHLRWEDFLDVCSAADFSLFSK
jgi:RNA polymerase sigma-70 factor (ECF subfamily)